MSKKNNSSSSSSSSSIAAPVASEVSDQVLEQEFFAHHDLCEHLNSAAAIFVCVCEHIDSFIEDLQEEYFDNNSSDCEINSDFNNSQ